jgi:hypothetical protein
LEGREKLMSDGRNNQSLHIAYSMGLQEVPVSRNKSTIWSLKAPYAGLFKITQKSIIDGSLNNRNEFLTVLETGNPRSRCRQNWFHSEASSLGFWIGIFFLCFHMVPLCIVYVLIPSSFFFFFGLYLFIYSYMCIHCLGHLSLPAPPPLPLPPIPLTSRQNLFCSLL